MCRCSQRDGPCPIDWSFFPLLFRQPFPFPRQTKNQEMRRRGALSSLSLCAYGCQVYAGRWAVSFFLLDTTNRNSVGSLVLSLFL